jgi:hypothetical protein
MPKEKPKASKKPTKKTSVKVKPVVKKKKVSSTSKQTPTKRNRTGREPKKALKPKVFTFIGHDGITYTLTPQQKLFGELFCQMSMNSVDALIEAGYNVTNSKGFINYRLASSMASENLKKPNVSMYITSILDKYGLNDDNLDKQALGVANQWGDLASKMRAVDILYKKRGSYAPEKYQMGLDREITEALDRLQSIIRPKK